MLMSFFSVYLLTKLSRIVNTLRQMYLSMCLTDFRYALSIERWIFVIYYYNSYDQTAPIQLAAQLTRLLSDCMKPYCPPVLLCIGTDRSTGDCLGPLIGYKLSNYLKERHMMLYGTLASPVHAGNLDSTLSTIKEKHPHAPVIAVDASLGTSSHIGYVTLGTGSIRPGLGVQKELPEAGDICITGIVNFSGRLNHLCLQTTRLSTVMQLADCISFGIISALIYREQVLLPR